MRIIINGREYHREKREVSYEEIVAHVYGESCKAIISITYLWKGPGDTQRQGILSPGKTVEAEDGMSFSAYYTGNA